MTPRLDRDEGSVLPLIAVFAALGLAVILLATAVTSLYLERKRLFSVADAAALSGAEAFDLDQISVEGDAFTVDLRDADVHAAVEDYVSSQPHDAFDALHVDDARADGGTATVTLSARWRPPVVAPFFPSGITIDVTSTARSVLR